MTGFILVIGVSVMVAFQDGSQTRETSTIEMRQFETEERCNQVGNQSKLNIYTKNHRYAASLGATIKELDLIHECVPVSEAM